VDLSNIIPINQWDQWPPSRRTARSNGNIRMDLLGNEGMSGSSRASV
jgi:hypothetical protein